MNFFLEEVDGIKIIRIKEERLDTSVAPDLKAQLLVLINQGKAVLLNLEDVEYADSSGLGAILLGFRQARDAGGDFAICGVQKRVETMIHIAQLTNVITIYKDQFEALEQMKNVD
ncbi:anti-sigma factor antagonist [candidate division KSB1 bacterium]|nr:STAS domain-containing protein [candidate division KSB1 bacterium]RQW05212.1 MAG: anti-sigma factor antagonist [candidate division KSB1 bacterium]